MPKVSFSRHGMTQIVTKSYGKRRNGELRQILNPALSLILISSDNYEKILNVL